MRGFGEAGRKGRCPVFALKTDSLRGELFGRCLFGFRGCVVGGFGTFAGFDCKGSQMEAIDFVAPQLACQYVSMRPCGVLLSQKKTVVPYVGTYLCVVVGISLLKRELILLFFCPLLFLFSFCSFSLSDCFFFIVFSSSFFFSLLLSLSFSLSLSLSLFLSRSCQTTVSA